MTARRFSFLLPLTAAALLLTGCASMVETASREKMQEREMYADYRDTAERRNLEREKAGLPRQPILTLKEWRAVHQ